MLSSNEFSDIKVKTIDKNFKPDSDYRELHKKNVWFEIVSVILNMDFKCYSFIKPGIKTFCGSTIFHFCELI